VKERKKGRVTEAQARKQATWKAAVYSWKIPVYMSRIEAVDPMLTHRLSMLLTGSISDQVSFHDDKVRSHGKSYGRPQHNPRSARRYRLHGIHITLDEHYSMTRQLRIPTDICVRNVLRAEPQRFDSRQVQYQNFGSSSKKVQASEEYQPKANSRDHFVNTANQLHHSDLLLAPWSV